MVAVALAAAAADCTPYGATDVYFARANQRAPYGGALYDRSCAGCHGPRGEGLATFPPVMGPGALRRYVSQPSSFTPQQQLRRRGMAIPGVSLDREEFVTADDLYDYVAHHRRWVSHCCRELLDNDQYWAIVSYMLVAHGSNVPPGGVDPSNAKTVAIKPK